MIATIQILIDLLAHRPPPAEIDWDDLAVTAIAVGLAPLLHCRLEAHPLPDVPPLALAKLAITRQAHAQRNEAIAGQLAEILAECRRRGVPVIVLKGALLASLVYPEAALRPMNDIDLLFRPADLPAAAQILESLGYRGKHKSAETGPGVTKHLSTYRRDGGNGSTPNPYLSPAADRTVEPHGSLEESWFGLRADITPGVWQRAEPVQLGGQPALRLSAADTLLHLSVHAAFHVIMGAAVFVQLYDVKQVTERWQNQLDWRTVQARAAETGAVPFVAASLGWATQLFDAPVPPSVLADARAGCPPRLLAHVDRLDAVGLFRRAQQPPLTGVQQRLRRGLSDRAEAARWGRSLREKWRVWQTALAVHKTDTATLLLRKGEPR